MRKHEKEAERKWFGNGVVLVLIISMNEDLASLC